MIIGNRDYDLKKKTYIMGILNVTPDSFSDGGAYNNTDAALKRTEQMIHEGADIIDVGAESTRPGSQTVTAEEEMDRLLPIIEAIKKNFDIPISADTYKAETARAAIGSGADLINDIWGLRADNGEMARVIADTNIPCILMHNRKEAGYKDLIPDMLKDLDESLKTADSAGIDRKKIILDPGIGFGKTYEDNLMVLANLDAFNETGLPMLLGCSRKSVIGLALDLPVDERLEGTLVTTVLAAQAGYGFVRVHDIAANRRVLDMLEMVKSHKKH